MRRTTFHIPHSSGQIVDVDVVEGTHRQWRASDEARDTAKPWTPRFRDDGTVLAVRIVP